ncbi:hypothetical protein P152DRAFT_517924 [Eremomyces bilateralis CBS 781.70]|uniref:Aminoglycoside phosphotransferase domain-containing protein n=1 Tax=Eremomyces bilateralis CBS 781.70 TaxID=1392243 RepID=A0A6G1FQ80_9PEZI|nr:uncharacterized protein P152DRAFT_517924 [Eremomyces bilateralis CBS 781.70]KAF1807964.1 hypothetical protein P152DRAFT_517924 [Eremomyces bilateralis CBS 781.70]
MPSVLLQNFHSENISIVISTFRTGGEIPVLDEHYLDGVAAIQISLIECTQENREPATNFFSRRIDNNTYRVRNGRLPDITEQVCIHQRSLLPQVLFTKLEGAPYALDHGDLAPQNIIVGLEYNITGAYAGLTISREYNDLIIRFNQYSGIATIGNNLPAIVPYVVECVNYEAQRWDEFKPNDDGHILNSQLEDIDAEMGAIKGKVNTMVVIAADPSRTETQKSRALRESCASINQVFMQMNYHIVLLKWDCVSYVSGRALYG